MPKTTCHTALVAALAGDADASKEMAAWALAGASRAGQQPLRSCARSAWTRTRVRAPPSQAGSATRFSGVLVTLLRSSAEVREWRPGQSAVDPDTAPPALIRALGDTSSMCGSRSPGRCTD
jgi:hypothetical protein